MGKCKFRHQVTRKASPGLGFSISQGTFLYKPQVQIADSCRFLSLLSEVEGICVHAYVCTSVCALVWNRGHPSPGLDLKHGAWVWPFTLPGTLPFLLLYKSLVPGHLLLHPEPCRPIYHSSVPFLPHRDSYIFWCGYGFSLFFHTLSSHIFGAGESLKAWTYDTTVTRSLPSFAHTCSPLVTRYYAHLHGRLYHLLKVMGCSSIRIWTSV